MHRGMVPRARYAVIVMAMASAAHAQPHPVAPLVGATEVAKVKPAFGFIDDVVANDDKRVAYVVTDAGSHAEVHVLEGTQDTTADISALTTHPTALRLFGARAFVAGMTADDQQLGALIELTAKGKLPAGRAVFKTPVVEHVAVIKRDGKLVAALDDTTDAKTGVRHQVSLVALETGKRLAVGKPFEVDAKNTNAQLELKVNHWADGMTHAFGLKGGEWDKKENQRTPDVEATYDLVTGKFIDKKPIGDLFEQRKRFAVLASVTDHVEFVRMTEDGKAVELWRAGKPTPVMLDQPITNYDAKSLQGVINADGSAWIALKIDPVNADAVARKKADPEYLDIFQVTPDAKATRKSRILATGVRHLFGVAGDNFWLLERSSGSDRGGKALTFYKLGS
jgi:hypothetical protein